MKNMQEHASSLSLNTMGYIQHFIPNFKILGAVVQEKCFNSKRNVLTQKG